MRSFALAAAALAACCATAAAAPPPVDAPAYVVRGGPRSVVLAARAPDVPRAPASITKLMTVMVALEHARLDEMVTVTPQAAGVGESTVMLRPGERLSVRDLAIAALVPSANDAATALAVHVGHGSVARFVAMMNAKARLLGLTSTHFENPHGLDQAGPRVERPRRHDAARGRAPRARSSGGGRRGRRPRSPVVGPSPRPTTCSESCRSSEPRPVTRTRPGGRRSRRSSATASGSRRRSSGPRPRACGMPAWHRCSLGPRPVPRRPGGGRGPDLRSRGDRLRPSTGDADGPEVRRSDRFGWAGRSSSRSWRARPSRCPSSGGSGWGRCACSREVG